MLRLMLLIQAGAGDMMMHGLKATVDRAIGCSAPSAGEITVCARSNATRSPYRLPAIPGEDGFDPAGGRESVSRETHRVLDVGGAGAFAGACSAAGAGGQTGCMNKDWKERAEQYGFRPR